MAASSEPLVAEESTGLNAQQQNDRLLTALLLIGGIPPALSGLSSMFAAPEYLNTMGDNLSDLSSPAGMSLLYFIANLWGGDAFVAGTARATVALLGDTRTKLWFGAVALIHSTYELWLLPKRFLSWCRETEAECTRAAHTVISLFMSIHVVLISGFLFALFSAFRHKQH